MPDSDTIEETGGLDTTRAERPPPVPAAESESPPPSRTRELGERFIQRAEKAADAAEQALPATVESIKR